MTREYKTIKKWTKDTWIYFLYVAINLLTIALIVLLVMLLPGFTNINVNGALSIAVGIICGANLLFLIDNIEKSKQSLKLVKVRI